MLPRALWRSCARGSDTDGRPRPITELPVRVRLLTVVLVRESPFRNRGVQRGERIRECCVKPFIAIGCDVHQSEALEAQRLVELRDRWLNPPEWVEWIDEPVPGYPPRPVPRDEDAAKALKKRTLTNLYNARPQWLVDAHEALDAAVAATYGWSADVSDDEVLRELLALNGGGRSGSSDAVWSVDGSDGTVDSRLQCGKRRGNRGLCTDSNSRSMNELQEIGDSPCRKARIKTHG